MILIPGRRMRACAEEPVLREVTPRSDAIEEPARATPVPAGLPDMLARLGLGSSAHLLLDVLRPVSWLGAQLLWVAQPTLALFNAGEPVARLARTLENDHALDALAAALDPPPGEEPRRPATG